MRTMSQRNKSEFDERWEVMDKGMTKLKNLVEKKPELLKVAREYMMIYTKIYDMCFRLPLLDSNQELYDNYHDSIKNDIKSLSLFSLKEKHEEFLLRELVKRWSNHKIMMRKLSTFYHNLETLSIAAVGRLTLNEIGLACFHNMMFEALNGKVVEAVISLFDAHRQGKQVNQALLKAVEGIFAEVDRAELKPRSRSRSSSTS